MARQETSLLFSLKEIANNLLDRLGEEEQAKKAVLAAEKRAQQEACKRAQQEEQAQRHAAEEAARRQREEIEAREREQRIFVETARKRAQIEAEEQRKLAQLRAETEAILSKPLPRKTIASVCTLFAMIGFVTVVFVKRAQDRAQQEAILQAVANIESQRKNDSERQAHLRRLVTQRFEEMERLKSKKNRTDAAIAHRIEQDTKKEAEIRKKQQAWKKIQRAKEEAEKEQIRKLRECLRSNDPACGLIKNGH